MSTKTIERIYELREEDQSIPEIAESLSLSEKYVKIKLYSKEYRAYEEIKVKELELQRSSSPRERTRLLVDELLKSVEEEMSNAKSPKEKLRCMDAVKQLVGIVGIDADDSQGLNVVEVPMMMSKDEFNRAGAKTTGPAINVSTKHEALPLVDLESVSVDVNHKVCTAVSSGIAPNTQNPTGLSEEPEGYETPTPTHISENSPPVTDIWDNLKVEGLD